MTSLARAHNIEKGNMKHGAVACELPTPKILFSLIIFVKKSLHETSFPNISYIFDITFFFFSLFTIVIFELQTEKSKQNQKREI
jgi:hypothetical protein